MTDENPLKKLPSYLVRLAREQLTADGKPARTAKAAASISAHPKMFVDSEREPDVDEPANAIYLHIAEQSRPKTRGDCVNGVRPCPYVTCKYHLAHISDYNMASGIRFRFAGHPDDAAEKVVKMGWSCSLDFADMVKANDVPEVAEAMGIPYKTIEPAYRSAIRKLRESKSAQDVFSQASDMSGPEFDLFAPPPGQGEKR